MKLSAGGLAPSAVVAAAMAYGSWPYVEAPSPTPKAPGKEKSAALDPSLLSPKLGEPPGRDPFHGAGGGRAASAGRGGPGAKGARGRAAAPAVAGKPPPDPRDGLSLQATLVRGRRRLAVINGRVYEAGEALAGTGREAGPVVLADVLPSRVVLENRGHRFALAFATAPAVGAKGPEVAAGPATIAGGSEGIGP